MNFEKLPNSVDQNNTPNNTIKVEKVNVNSFNETLITSRNELQTNGEAKASAAVFLAMGLGITAAELYLKNKGYDGISRNIISLSTGFVTGWMTTAFQVDKYNLKKK